METTIVSIRIIAETDKGDKLYLREDMGITVDPQIEQEIKNEVEACGFLTDWMD